MNQNLDAVESTYLPAAFVSLLFEYLQQKGCAQDVFPDAPMLDNDGLAPYPAKEFAERLDAARVQLDEPLLAFSLGQGFSIKKLGALGYAIACSDNLGDALLRLHRYQNLVQDTFPLSIMAKDRHMILQWSKGPGHFTAAIDELGVAAYLACLRELIAPDVSLPQIEFVNPAPASTTPYENYFGGRVLFAQDATRIHLPMALLQKPFSNADPTLCGYLEKQLEDTLDARGASRYVVQQVKSCINKLAYFGLPNQTQVAQELGYSHNQLRHHLARNGTSFLRLRNEVLMQLASAHLEKSELNLMQIANLLGYSEHSAFTRAFKSWSGKTPRQFRQSFRSA